jgi:replicative DNA helicase
MPQQAKDISIIGRVDPEADKIIAYLKDIKDGKIMGFSTGFPTLDKYVGRMDMGQMWIIGGYTGTGKSYFIINMIANQLTLPIEQRPKIVVVSTELSKQEYILRYILMVAGVYRLQYQNEPGKYFPMVYDSARAFFSQAKLDTDALRIYGDVSKLESIQKLLQYLSDKKELPHILYIDYIQELSVGSIYSEDKAMPIVSKQLKDLAKQYGICIVAVSQVNNYTVKDTFSQNNNPLLPFSNGKALANAAHAAIALARKVDMGQKSAHLQAFVVKARSGSTIKLGYEIKPGYKLDEIDDMRAKWLDGQIGDISTEEAYSHFMEKDDGVEDIPQTSF